MEVGISFDLAAREGPLDTGKGRVSGLRTESDYYSEIVPFIREQNVPWVRSHISSVC